MAWKAFIPAFVFAVMQIAFIGYYVLAYLAKINQELERLREKDEPGKNYDFLLKKEINKALTKVLLASLLVGVVAFIIVLVV